MKKRILSIILVLALCLTLMPMTAFADGSGFAINNGTPENAEETNHGYITVDETAAEGDTVTVEVHPAEGYQLKSLTATPVAPTISTIADVLATVEGFPKDIIENSSPTAPSDAWTNGTGSAFTYKNLALVLKSSSYMYAQLTTGVTFDATNKCYTATVSTLGTLKFNMTDGVLTSFTYTHKEGKPEQYDGTYAPASTPSAKLKPITPAKQEDGTYQFEMPGYDVTVTAEFAVTIADILPDNFPASVNDNTWCQSKNDNVYIYKTDSDLVFNDSTEDIYSVPLSSFLTKQENPKVSYVYSKDGTIIQFNMTGDDDELESIVVSDCTTNTSCIGIYAYEAPEAFSVTYNANGATSGSAPANQTKTAGVNLTLATNTGSLAKADYTFAGWNTKADGSGTHYDTGATYTTDAALTLYAEWIEASATKTVADILPDDFPTLSGFTIPSSAWKNSADSKMYIANNGLTFGGESLYNILNASVTKVGDNFEYNHSTGIKITFVMNSEKLVKITIEGSKGADNNGNYLPPAHTHAFTYTANNGKLTATCTAGCDKGYDTTPLTLTLTAPASLVYDGNAKTFTFANGEAAAWTGAGLELPNIVYTKWNDSFYVPHEGAPTEAGSYFAHIYAGGDGANAFASFTINKATPYIKTTPAPNEIEYGEKLLDSTLFGGYVQISSTDSTEVGGWFEWTNGNIVPSVSDSDVTEYGVTFTPSSEYEKNYNTVTCQVKIRVNHTHNPELVNGQAPQKGIAGWQDYYECICGERYEDASGSILIPDLAVWKAEGGNGYLAPLPTHSSGGGSTPTVTVPVTGDENSVKVSASVSGSTATIKDIKDADLAKVTGGESVEIDLTGLKKDIDTAKIPTATVEKIGEQAGMSVKLTTATVSFDKTATQEIAAQTKGNTVELVVDDIKEVSLNAVQKEAVQKLDTALIIDAYLVSNGTKLCTEGDGGFNGGKATVMLPYEIKNNRSASNYNVYYVDDAGKLEKLAAKYDTKLGAFVFDIEHFSNYVVAYDENACPQDETCVYAKFTDADTKAWYHDGVHFCVANGYMQGVSADKFAPNGTLSRGMIVTMLWRMEGEPVVNYAMSFKDVPADKWYTEAIRWAQSTGVVDGYSADAFGPSDDVTREQLAAILYNYAKLKGQGFTGSWMFLLDFVDRADISSWADEAVHWCSMKGIVNGKDGKVFDPQGNATRAEAASMVQRFCEAVSAEE